MFTDIVEGVLAAFADVAQAPDRAVSEPSPYPKLWDPPMAPRVIPPPTPPTARDLAAAELRDKIQAIRAAVEAGQTPTEIAAWAGCSRSSVRRYARATPRTYLPRPTRGA